jgi:crossover junction endodeoxyribonuclease RusA
MIVLELPYPPSVNHYWRHVGPRVLVSRDGRAYQRAVMLACGRQQGYGMSRLAVTVDAYPPDRRRRDLDNLGKALFDALGKAGLYHDDSQIRDLHLLMHEHDPARSGVIVTIKLYTGAQHGHTETVSG